jgi:hypothetical protein
MRSGRILQRIDRFLSLERGIEPLPEIDDESEPEQTP